MSWLRRLREISINKQIVIAFLGLSLLYALIIVLSTSHYYSETVRKEFANVSREATHRLNYFLDYYFNLNYESKAS